MLDRALADDPDREALVTRTHRLTYAELDRQADRAAHALADLGRRHRRPGGGVPAQRGRRGRGLPRRHAPRRGLGRRQPGPGPAREALAARRLRRLAAARRRPARRRRRAGGRRRRLAGGARRRGRRSGRRGRRPVRPGRASPTRAAPPVAPRARCTASTTCCCPAPCWSRRRGYGPELRKGDCFPFTILNMAVLTTLLVSQAGGTLDRDGPHRRRGRGRVDPRRAGHDLERAARAAPQPRHHGRRSTPSDLASARRGVDRRRRLPRGHPRRRSRPSSACRCWPPTG